MEMFSCGRVGGLGVYVCIPADPGSYVVISPSLIELPELISDNRQC